MEKKIYLNYFLITMVVDYILFIVIFNHGGNANYLPRVK